MIGIAFIIIGIIFRMWAIKSIKNFSVLILKQQSFVDTGAYRIMRHPAYFGSLLIITGISLLNVHAGILLTAYSFFMSRMMTGS